MRLRPLAIAALAVGCSTPREADPLPSWNDGAAKAAILAFLDEVQAADVPAAERIAVFDNDGTLWSEQPLYFQALFAFDRVRALAPQHPEWSAQEPFASVLKGDVKAALAGGEKALLELVMATHAGMTTDQFAQLVADWLATARHPQTGRPFPGMTYQPMLELLDCLRAHGFRTWIVSGGGVEFMRPWVEAAYGVPPEQVVGSAIRMTYELRDGRPAIVRLPELDFLDDKEGKPVGIQRAIGRRPLAAFGNSDGDFQMLEWTAAGPGPRLALLVHHDDAAREWAYDRASHVGRLARGLDEAAGRGWTVVSMKDDWRVIHPPAE